MDYHEEVYEPEDHHDVGADASAIGHIKAITHYDGENDEQSEVYGVEGKDHRPFCAFHPTTFVNKLTKVSRVFYALLNEFIKEPISLPSITCTFITVILCQK